MKMKIVSRNEAPTLDTIQELVARLEHGDQLINRMDSEGRDTRHLVQHWLRLLRDYEIACLERDLLAA